MSDSEDDYMSDKLLKGCEKEDIRPGLIFSRKQKRQHEIYKKSTETQPKPYKEVENQLREEGLSKEISASNKGFMLLQKMGYKAGTSLGKSQTGLIEPIPVTLKSNKAGIGLQKPSEILKRKKLENHAIAEKKFRAFNVEKDELWSLKKDLRKAQKACEDLDFRNNVKVPLKPFFWSKEALEQLVKNKKEGSDEEEEEEEDIKEVEDNKQMVQEKLEELLKYLRETYYYCVYCVAKGEDDEDLKSFCPGLTRDDHDEEN